MTFVLSPSGTGRDTTRKLWRLRRFVKRWQIKHRTADLDALQGFLAGSSQTDDSIEVPEGHYEDETMKLTVVPNRNMIFLSVAAAWAVSEGFHSIAYAAHAGDRAIYPDCRVEFVDALRGAMALCHYYPVQVLTPFISEDKTGIAKIGRQLDVPYAETWTCYKGEEFHCGRCGACVERNEALTEVFICGPNDLSEGGIG